MSLEKAIQHGKEHRKPYRGSKRFDRSCRNHGRCPYCENNRSHPIKKALVRTEGQEDEYWGYWGYPDPIDADIDHGESLENNTLD